MDLDLDPGSPVPLFQQIVDQVRRLVALGALCPGDRLPAVRELAVQARVNRNTAARAIQTLEAQGLVRTRVGQGTFVSDQAPALGEQVRESVLEEAMDHLLEEGRKIGLEPLEVARKFARKVESLQEEEGESHA
jgi:GntR family transcriptional regulator